MLYTPAAILALGAAAAAAGSSASAGEVTNLPISYTSFDIHPQSCAVAYEQCLTSMQVVKFCDFGLSQCTSSATASALSRSSSMSVTPSETTTIMVTPSETHVTSAAPTPSATPAASPSPSPGPATGGASMLGACWGVVQLVLGAFAMI